MRILLVRPPNTRLKGSGQAPYFPLGIGYVTGVLRQHGFDAWIYQVENPGPNDPPIHIDPDVGFNSRSTSYRRYVQSLKQDDHPVWQEVRETIANFKPDLVGLSLLSVEVGSSLKISKLVKEYDPRIPVVWGGLHPSFLPDECLDFPEVDYVVRGEGELTMLEFCQVLANNGDLAAVQGLSFIRNGEHIHNPPRAAIKDLNELPLPAREAVLYPDRFDFKSLGSMIISRGCPFRCTFCSSPQFWNSKVRFRNSENVLSEIRFLQEHYGCSHIMLWDDSFTINKKVIERFCHALMENNLKISWKAATRADLINEELLDLMRRSGCVKLEIGVESGSDRLKKIIYKEVDNAQIKRAFELINKSGISSGAFFMAGFPDETREDMDQTFQLMKELEAAEMAFNILDPMPGSPEYHRCIEYGLAPAKPDWSDFPFWPDAHYMKNMSAEEFSSYANQIAKWLYDRNNSLSYKLKRHKSLIMFLLKNDPAYLVRKVFDFAKRRMNVVQVQN